MEIKNFLICLVVCFLLSFLIGVERQYRRRIIGLRTTILVSIGAFLFVSMSFNVSNNDLTRIASQVVTGIGFLGAGVIIKDGLKVRGLTTAATLWCDAAIGVLCASGLLIQAILGTAVILFANIVLRYINRIINQKTYNNHAIETYELGIVSDSENLLDIKKTIDDFLRKNSRVEMIIQSLSIKEHKEILINLNVKKTYNMYVDKLVDTIYSQNKISSLKCKKLMEIENEEEEEL